MPLWLQWNDHEVKNNGYTRQVIANDHRNTKKH
ncbi:hypothetical protein [Allocoleopsis franciscana]|nr:hypothetical protein [Allocoleopsis franciscana]